MITDTQYFNAQILKIEEKIFDDNLVFVPLDKMKINKFSKEDITHYYNNTFLNFPWEIQSAKSQIGISIFATELFELYYDLNENSSSVSSDKIQELKNKREKFNAADHLELVLDFIQEFVHNMVYSYDKILENTKKHHFFVNIDDEQIILLNLLKRYKSVINDKSKQLDIFWSISLDKSISDIILSMCIEFIEQRLKILNITLDEISTEYKTTYIENNIKQICWNGTQQEFCELIIELEKNNWIENIKNGERKQFIDSITKVFNFDKTKRKEKSDPKNSLYQLFKGEYISNERTFPFLENEKYQRKFNLIEKNNS